MVANHPFHRIGEMQFEKSVIKVSDLMAGLFDSTIIYQFRIFTNAAGPISICGH